MRANPALLLEVMAGLRMDNIEPEGFFRSGASLSVDPRLNLRYQLLNPENSHFFKDLSLRAGYGRTTKSPTLIHLYPDKDYNDIVSFNYYPELIVATTTEIHDYLRLLYAAIGKPHCPKCGRAVEPQSATQITDQILAFPPQTRLVLLAPVINGKKGRHEAVQRVEERQCQQHPTEKDIGKIAYGHLAYRIDADQGSRNCRKKFHISPVRHAMDKNEFL